MMFRKIQMAAVISVASLGVLITACESDDDELTKEDVIVVAPSCNFSLKIGQLIRMTVDGPTDKGVSYQWLLDDNTIAQTKDLEYMMEIAGNYKLTLMATKGKQSFSYGYNVTVSFEDTTIQPVEGATAYITQVFDFLPAVGQFTNELPKYEEGDTQEIMNGKVLNAIGNNNKGMISLGGFGGYVVVGFDHTIKNVPGKRDFRVLGNAFYANANPDPTAPKGGSCEPGVIMVAYDANKNGVPDDNEWYEIAGSSHVDATQELWYQKALDAKNDVKTHFNYEITYHRPTTEPTNADEMKTYIRWEDNLDNEGYKVKNAFHRQCYYPLWTNKDKITFKGTCLPQNGVDESGQGSYFVLYKFIYGYADNEVNAADDSAIDIDWAVNYKGEKVKLPGVDFIKVYTGVNQENGWLGECSTEVTGIDDLHILNVDIDTRK